MRAATMTSTLCDSTFRRLTEAWTLDTSRGYAHRTTAAARWWVDLNSLSNRAQDMRESGCRPSVSSDGGHHSGNAQQCVRVSRRKSSIRRSVNAAALCAGNDNVAKRRRLACPVNLRDVVCRHGQRRELDAVKIKEGGMLCHESDCGSGGPSRLQERPTSPRKSTPGRRQKSVIN